MNFKPIHALGLMSGTSMDGVDVAHLITNGENHIAFGATSFLPYSDTDRSLLRAAIQAAKGLTSRTARPHPIVEAENLIDQRHIEAVRAFRAANPDAQIDLVGYHGQTILHRPEQRLTVQIGRGQVLADALQIPVIYDMRAADVAAGGQGAPLVPVFHRALVQAAGLGQNIALLNIGGVANITYLQTPDADPMACDIGPGNALLDDLMLQRTGVAMDKDGSTAATGTINEMVLAQYLGDSFFELPAPKSLDRNAFDVNMVEDLTTQDAAATLTAFTAQSIAKLLPHLPGRLSELIICGGGVRNPTLIQFIRDALQCTVSTAEKYGWSADALEAQAFAYLAVRSLRGLDLTFPNTTGVAKAMSGGVLARPADSQTSV